MLALLVVASRPGSDSGTPTLVSRVPLKSTLEDPDWQRSPPEWQQTAVRVPAVPSEDLQVVVPREGVPAPEDRTPAGLGLGPSHPADLVLPTGSFVGGGLQGRTPEGRAKLVAVRGGNQQSEAAVERGLWWLVAHQLDDGSWNFNHQKSACGGLCRNPGNVASTTGATAISLLAFLGAGYTHTEGSHQDTVRRGLYYLTSRALVTPAGADLEEGTMYAQGLAAIALSEAFAMTRDPALEDLAQQAIDFIVHAQDRQGGGWRYTPGEPGDTTVTGWQVMALKSAQSAGLRVPLPNVYLIQRFLDGVQREAGARYGYMTREPRNTTTAIGLLCRMFTGWRRSNPALARGVAYLSQWGPSEDDIYYDYYATQVLYHWEGSDWVRWNRRMRDDLIASQATDGHEAGSWYFQRHGKEGGRLYSTAMAVMTLEVYYRYLPLYTPVPLD